MEGTTGGNAGVIPNDKEVMRAGAEWDLGPEKDTIFLRR
jgi:hypothetical protein